MRIVFIGCVEFSAAALRMLLTHQDAKLVGVVTLRSSSFNTDFADLTPLAEQANCPILYCDDMTQSEIAAWLRNQKPEVVYCLGWSSLLSADLLVVPTLGVVGYHPAALPHNRGRHPIIWALALGLKETASTFFLMDEHADSGDILSQTPVAIEENDDACSLYRKLIDTALPQLKKLTHELAHRKVKQIPQDHSQANYWRKRSSDDGRIDWRMSAQSIYNLVRALAQPYPGAFCEYQGHPVTIWRARPINNTAENLEPGKVLKVRDDTIQVKCGEGVVELLVHTFDPIPEEGSYL